MKWIIDKAFHNTSKNYIYISNYNATWYKRKNAYYMDKDTLIKHINHLINNVYICIGQHVRKQVIGIPMGTDCAPYLANLYLYALEYKFLEKLTKSNIHLARKFSTSHRYIDDLITFNNNRLMDTYKYEIYPKELILNKRKP